MFELNRDTFDVKFYGFEDPLDPDVACPGYVPFGVVVLERQVRFQVGQVDFLRFF